MFRRSIDLFAGSKQLLKNTDITITYPNKYGLVGYNGSGKSTFLKYLYDSFSSEMDVYYVTQNFVDLEGGNTDGIKDLILRANGKRETLRLQIQILEEKLETLSDAELETYTVLQEEFAVFVKDEAIVSKILSKLGFTTEQQNSPLGLFSGGWRMRVSLARGLYISPKFLLLDEPTNHLDLEGIIWLMDYLNFWPHSLILVCHDRFFIDEVCNCIIHINQNKLDYYSGDFTKFEEAYAQKLTADAKAYKVQQSKIREFHKKNLSNELILEKLGIPIELSKKYKVSIEFPDPGIVKSYNILSLENLSFEFGAKPIFTNMDFYVDAKTRIVLVGKNGAGKSTLLKILAGILQPSRGKIIRDPRSRTYYYDQFTETTDISLIDYLKQVRPNENEQNIRKMLGTAGFEGNMHRNRVSSLSGGQIMKLRFLPIILEKPHVLLLDEPTNNLDLESVSALIHGLNSFKGGVVLVTHNVTLIQNINAKIALVEDETIKWVTFERYSASILT